MRHLYYLGKELVLSHLICDINMHCWLYRIRHLGIPSHQSAKSNSDNKSIEAMNIRIRRQCIHNKFEVFNLQFKLIRKMKKKEPENSDFSDLMMSFFIFQYCRHSMVKTKVSLNE